MMMLSQAAAATNGKLLGADVMFDAVSKDTRDMPDGALYVALKGENFDGEVFVEEAAKAGAVAALVNRQQPCSLPQVAVEDTRLALGELAADWRSRFDGRVIGITGSNGKTTVKEMCRSILIEQYGDEKVLCTRGNLNNDIGMPMTLLELRRQHEVAVIEMGANHVGEIAYLTAIARPDVAVLTNAGAAHIEGFGSLENIAHAKAEIYDGLPDDGVAVINADDDYFELWKNKNQGRRMLTFSMSSEDADVVAKQVTADGFVLKTDVGEARVSLKVFGEHNVMNALAATAATRALGVGLDDIVSALQAYDGVGGRLQFLTAAAGYRVIDDSYNANPYSLEAAIKVLVAQGEEPWLVLGDMGELGADAAALHRDAGVRARSLGVKRLFATGELTRHAVDGFGAGAKFYPQRDALFAELLAEIDESVIVLVKGSRSMRMEEVVGALQGAR